MMFVILKHKLIKKIHKKLTYKISKNTETHKKKEISYYLCVRERVLSV